jgi:hypothetical protein
MTFSGPRFADLIERSGVSKSAIARHLEGPSAGQVNYGKYRIRRYIAGKTVPNEETQAKLAEALNCAPQDLAEE